MLGSGLSLSIGSQQAVVSGGGGGGTGTSSLTDNFNDNSRNVSLWNVSAWRASTTTLGGTTAETNSRLEVTASTTIDQSTGYVSVNTYSLANDAVYVKPTLATAIDGNQEFFLAVGPDTSNYYRMDYFSGTLYCQSLSGGTTTTVGSLPYVAANHAWWRIRHATSGDTVYFEAAPSTASNPPLSGDWTILFSAVRTITITASKVAMQIAAVAANASPATAYFDGLNSAT